MINVINETQDAQNEQSATKQTLYEQAKAKQEIQAALQGFSGQMQSGLMQSEQTFIPNNSQIQTGGLLGSSSGYSHVYRGPFLNTNINEDVALQPTDWTLSVTGNGVRAVRMSLPVKDRAVAIKTAIKALRLQLKAVSVQDAKVHSLSAL